MKKIPGLAVFFILISTFKVSAQRFDSAKIYSVCLDRTFYTRIDKVDIKFITDTVFRLKTADADSIYVTFQNNIKLDHIKTLPSKSLIDIRMSADFYKNGEVASNISLGSGGTCTIDNRVYSYKRKDLKRLDTIVPDISRRLCVR